MQDSNLIKTLRTFSKEEINSFEKFVSSPYFNTSDATVKLFKEIKKFYPGFDSKDMDRKLLFKRAYGSGSFNEVLMRKLVSNLIKLSDEFIAVNTFRKNRLEVSVKMLNGLYERKLHKNLNAKIKEAGGLLNDYKFRSEDYYLNKYLIHYVACNFNIEMNNFSSPEIFQLQINEINNYYLANVLRLYSMLAMYKHTLDLEFDLWFIDEINSYMNKNEGKIEDDILLFYCTLKMFSSEITEAGKYYFKAKELFQKTRDVLKLTDSKFALYLLTNFCMMMIGKGDSTFFKEKFELLKIDAQLSKLQQEHLDSNHYLNTLATAAGAQEFGWAEKYIEDMKHKLMPERSEDTYKYAKAMLLYSQKKYSETLGFLSTISPTFWQSKSYIKDLTIKAYFELAMYEDIYYQVDSYRHYIKKAKDVPKYMRERDEEFIRHLQKLINLKNKPDWVETEILINEISKSNSSHKDWLLSKLEKQI